jgi:NADPH:quinone reductase
MPRTGRAVRFDRYGGRGELYIERVMMDSPPSGEVLVQVKAAGINPGEASIREGQLEDRFPATFPSGEGSDLAGIVVEVGGGVVSLDAGDEVLGWSNRRSSHADFVAVPEDQLVRKPSALSFEVAGALCVAGCTAYAVARAVRAGPGDTVAVSGAAGGVGSILVQLLVTLGAQVIGIASSPNHEWLRSVGAMPVAYGEGVAERIKEAAPEGVDAFIDTFGGYVELAIDLGVAPERVDTIIDFDAAERYGVKTDGSADGTSTETLAHLADLAASKKIVVPIASTYPLEEVRAAYAELERRHTRGKIVLVM